MGLDVSHWNVVDWADWAARAYRFVYIKCTEGTGWVDNKWMTHQAAAETEDFYTGPYHYFRVAWDGATQAQHFYNTVSVRQWDMPPAIDVERTNNNGFTKAEFATKLKACLDKTEELFQRKPVIYTSRTMWNELVGTVTWAKDYDLWVAHYGVTSPSIPEAWAGQQWKLWQYTSTPLDQNRFNGELDDFLRWIGVVVPPPGGGELEARVTKLEEEVAELLALVGRLHGAYHG